VTEVEVTCSSSTGSAYAFLWHSGHRWTGHGVWQIFAGQSVPLVQTSTSGTGTGSFQAGACH
jgi:hypothetical protein